MLSSRKHNMRCYSTKRVSTGVALCDDANLWPATGTVFFFLALFDLSRIRPIIPKISPTLERFLWLICANVSPGAVWTASAGSIHKIR